MPHRARSRTRWPPSPWLRCWRAAWPVSRQSPCSCGASTRHAKPPVWRRAGMTGRPSRSRERSRPPEPCWICAATTGLLLPRSPLGRIFCPPFSSRPTGSRRRNPDGDRGSATVLAAAMVAVVLCVLGAGADVGSVLVARHRSQAAADLAAVSAAARLPAGPEAACERAAWVARRMRAEGLHCAVSGLDVVVTVDVALRLPRLRGRSAHAAARAGP